MSDERDIVERLGEVSGWHSDTREINEQAASKIQRLRGEVERLREGVKRAIDTARLPSGVSMRSSRVTYPAASLHELRALLNLQGE